MGKLISYGGRRIIPGPPYLKVALRITIVLLVVVVVLVNLLTHVFMVVRYYGNGMEPTLQDRQVLVLRKTDKVKQGDIIAFYYNNKVLIRRVVCEGNRSIAIDDTGVVSIDNVPLEEPYVMNRSIGQHTMTFPLDVPYGQFFVMGDNREISMDSRIVEIGTIPSERIIGKVVMKF